MGMSPTSDRDQPSAILRDAQRIRAAVDSVMQGLVERIQRAVDEVAVGPDWETEIRAEVQARPSGLDAEAIIADRRRPTTWLEALDHIEQWLPNEHYRRELQEDAVALE